MTRDYIRDRTIRDFGDQWTRYSENDGYYASIDCFWDIFSPLLSPEDIRGKKVADIGSGTGRMVRMLAEVGAAEITAVEPSAAFSVLKDNTEDIGEIVRYVKDTGDRIDRQDYFDCIVSMGVIHHIPEPEPVIRAAFQALKPGGKLVIWIYGKEGNKFYLGLAGSLRFFTTRMPNSLLAVLSWILCFFLTIYMNLCRIISLPMRDYMLNTILRLSPAQRRLTIFDQLNPRYAKYYTRSEAEQLLAASGFIDVKTKHRHGYSWTVMGRKPGEKRN